MSHPYKGEVKTTHNRRNAELRKGYAPSPQSDGGDRQAMPEMKPSGDHGYTAEQTRRAAENDKNGGK